METEGLMDSELKASVKSLIDGKRQNVYAVFSRGKLLC